MGQDWHPILEYKVRERALQTVEKIADDLKKYQTEDASLASGSAGLAILFSYLERKPQANQFQNQAISALQTVAMEASLYSGITGIGWTIEHLDNRSGGKTKESEIDEVLAKLLQLSPWSRDYDLINGLVGFGVYALERLPNFTAQHCVELVVDRLAEISVENEKGIAWFSHPSLLPDFQRKECPEGFYNLGLAHGIPGVIAFLSLVVAERIRSRKAKRLLEGSVRWMLNHQLPAGASSYFPSLSAKNLPPEASRSAWCYGDPGIAAALFAAANALDKKAWRKEAMKIALHATERPTDQARVKDSCICHGSAGLAHIYNRFFQRTGNPKFKKAAQFWFQRTLELSQSDSGIGGYLNYQPDPDGTPRWIAEAGILNGAAGIALALHAACTKTEPRWDRMLLLS